MLPKLLHPYQNHHLDSLRWERFIPRADDIIIASSYKSGTTWTQEIVRQLINWNQGTAEQLGSPWVESPWLELRLTPIDLVIDTLEAQNHRRFIKTHLALDGLPFYSQVSYIVLGRDPRDVFMSLWNHYSNVTDQSYESDINTPGRVGPPLPLCPADLHQAWQEWITRGWFEWESEGYPYWGNMHHTQSWWNYRHLDNIVFVHYNNLVADLPKEIQRLAAFLDVTIPETEIAAMLPALRLETMRRSAPDLSGHWREGARSFFYKGTNGRWKDVLTDEELEMYEDKASKVLTPDCRAWLEQGRMTLS